MYNTTRNVFNCTHEQNYATVTLSVFNSDTLHVIEHTGWAKKTAHDFLCNKLPMTLSSVIVTHTVLGKLTMHHPVANFL